MVGVDEIVCVTRRLLPPEYQVIALHRWGIHRSKATPLGIVPQKHADIHAHCPECAFVSRFGKSQQCPPGLQRVRATLSAETLVTFPRRWLCSSGDLRLDYCITPIGDANISARLIRLCWLLRPSVQEIGILHTME